MPEDAAWLTDPASPERHLVAGPKALAALARLLGLAAGWSVEAACCQGRQSSHMALKNGDRRLVLFLEPMGAGIALSAEAPSGPAIARLLSVLSARLGKRSFLDVVGLVEGDADSFVEHRRPDQETEDLRVPYVGAPFGLQEAGWRNFYGDQDFEVLLGVPECSFERTITLEYADLECFYARAELNIRRWSFLDWPNDKEDEIGARKSAAIAVELDERDMVLGTTEKADAVIAKALELTKAGHSLVVCHLCTPIVMGEDLNGLAHRLEKISGCTPVSWSQKDRDNLDNFGEFLRQTLGKPGYFDCRPDPLAVNLFHFPERYRKEELIPFLEGIGVKVNAAVFPMMDFPSVERLAGALSQVFCERSSYPVKLKELLEPHGRKIVDVPAPYGLANTRACLEKIAAAAGRQKEFKAAWARRMREIEPAWEKLKASAAGKRVAFVVSEATLPRLSRCATGSARPWRPWWLRWGSGSTFYTTTLMAEQLPRRRKRLRRGYTYSAGPGSSRSSLKRGISRLFTPTSASTGA